MSTKPRFSCHRIIALGCVVALAACSGGGESVQVPGAEVAETVDVPRRSDATVATPSASSEAPDGSAETTTPPTASPPSTVPATAPATPPSGAPTPTTTDATIYYRQGDSGPEISTMQRKLITTGYLAQGGDTGVFDAATESALRRFQTDYGLGVDGVFGPLTNTSLTAAANSVRGAG